MPTTLDNAVERTTQRRGPVQCKPLLDAATKDLFRNNAFRITGLSIEATRREEAKHADELKLREELGQSATTHAGAVALNPPPTLDQIREATGRLKDPEKRLIDEFFWFWPCEPGRATPDPALEALASDNADAALKIPYAIYYRITGDEVQVWRVLDCRRDPRWIRRQLRNV